MADNPITTKAGLLAETENAHADLENMLDRLTHDQRTQIHDLQGWTVKDHVAHLAAWQRSVVFMLQGRPRYEGLEVSQRLYMEGSFDPINAAIQTQYQNLSWSEVLDRFQSTHQQFMDGVRRLGEADLNQPCRRYLPDEPGQLGDRPVVNALYANSAQHFREHMNYIQALVGADE